MIALTRLQVYIFDSELFFEICIEQDFIHFKFESEISIASSGLGSYCVFVTDKLLNKM